MPSLATGGVEDNVNMKIVRRLNYTVRMFLLIILPLYCQLGWGQKWENNFLTLGEEVAKPF